MCSISDDCIIIVPRSAVLCLIKIPTSQEIKQTTKQHMDADDQPSVPVIETDHISS